MSVLTRKKNGKRFLFNLSFLLLVMLCSFPFQISADQAQYFYDELGRLVGVIDGQGNIASYEYDAVGNLLSISRSPVATPAITGVSPNPIEAVPVVPIIISGTSLLLSSVTTSNADIQIGQITTNTETTIETTLDIPNPTTFGATTLTVTVPGGSATTTITVNQPVPTITQLSGTVLPPGATVTIEGTGFATVLGSNQVTFPGDSGARIAATVVSESFTSLTVQIPAGTTSGDVTVQVGTLTSNAVFFTTPGITVIPVTATIGIPADPVLASANAGQNVQLDGAGFANGSTLDVPVFDQNGVSSIALVPLTNVSPDGTTANITVPATAATGLWALSGSTLAGVPVQIIPTTSSLDGTVTIGQPVDILGSGFQEGFTTVLFPGAVGPVAATDVQFTNNRLTVVAPPGVTGGTVIVITPGGTSNGVSVGIAVLQTITATNRKGTPADPLLPWANRGRITLHGVGFAPGMQATATTTSNSGVQGIATNHFLVNVSADGTKADIDLKSAVTTGPVSLGTGVVFLQIVPAIFRVLPAGTFEPGNEVSIQGAGFKIGESMATFEGSPEIVTTTNSAAVANTFHRAVIPNGVTLIPPGNATTITITTDGGTSNAFPVSHPVISGITGTANLGTPQDPTMPSANVNQVITVSGVSFIQPTRVFIPRFDPPSFPESFPRTVSSDGLSLTVRVPNDAITGGVAVQDANYTTLGSGTVTLQIVPTIVSVQGVAAEGEVLSITGTGFDPISTQVQFPGVSNPVVPLSVQEILLTVTAPVGTDFTGLLTVVTSGGTSNAFDLSASGNNEVEPNDSTATATPFNIGPPPRELTETKTGRIDPIGDVDFYQVDIDFIQKGPFFDPIVSLGDPGAPNLTLQLTWLDQDGVTVLETTQGTISSGSDLSLGFAPSVDGSYFFKIEEISGQGGSTHTYELEMNMFIPF